MLVNMTVTTRGMTTIRIALINKVPRGADPEANACSQALPVADAARPTISPKRRPAAIAMCNMD